MGQSFGTRSTRRWEQISMAVAVAAALLWTLVVPLARPAGAVVDGPTVTINQAGVQPDPTNGSTINFQAVFNRAVTQFNGADISFNGSTAPGALSVASIAGGPAIYTVTVTGFTGTGTVVVSVVPDGAIDVGGKGNQASTSTDHTVTVDRVAPTVAINQAATQTDPTKATIVNYTATFSEPVPGLAPGDIAFTGSTAPGTLAAAVTGGPTVYNVAVSGMTGGGLIQASIPAGVVTDPVGNPNTASTSTDNTVTRDLIRPGVTINQATTQHDPIGATPIKLTATFTENVTAFVPADVVFTGSTVGGTLAATITGGPKVFTVAVAGMTTAGLVKATIPANAAVDAAGNLSTASTSTDNTVTWDPSKPNVTINKAAGQADPSTGTSVSYTATFTKPVTGFAAADVVLASSTTGVGTAVTTVAGGPTAYTITVSGMSASGNVIATIPAGAAKDSALNGNLASTSSDNTIAWDGIVPSVTINQAAAQKDPVRTGPINYTVAFSEPVTGFDAADIALSGTAGGTKTAVVTGSGTTYNVAVSGMTTSGNVVVSVNAAAAADAVGNASVASTSTDNSVTWDVTRPLTQVNPATGQLAYDNTSPINLVVQFSEPVTGFLANDIVFTGSTAGGTLVATVTGSGMTYNVAITGMTTSGTVVVAVPALRVIDLAGNQNTPSSARIVNWDVTKPTVTINQAAGQPDPASLGPINFTATFSEAVTGFAGADISFTGSTASGTLSAVVTGGPTTYNVAVSGMTTPGNVVVSVPASKALDSAKNANLASTSTDATIAWNPAPTVTINQAAAQPDPDGTPPINFTVVFSEPVTGFTASDVNFAQGTAGGTLKATITGTGPTYNVAVTGMTTSGLVRARVNAGAAADAGGAVNDASTSTDNTVTWAPAPSVTINQFDQTDPSILSFIQFQVTFSEPVTGFEATDVSFAGTTAGGTLTPVVSGTGPTYLVKVTGMTTDGVVKASLPAGVATGPTGLASLASTSTDNTVTWDRTKPTVTINQAVGQADPASTGPITFTVVFSEPVTGFVGTDVTLSSSAGGTLVATVTGSGTTYSVAVTGMTTGGQVAAAVGPGRASDAANNTNVISTSTDGIVTWAPAPAAASPSEQPAAAPAPEPVQAVEPGRDEAA
jgi:hypothetical protein